MPEREREANTQQELEALLRRLEDAERLRSRFFADLSHELRTPLTLILGPTERLLDAPDLADGVRRDLRVVQRNAWMLLRQVEELLETARHDAGEVGLEPAPVDLSRLLSDIGDHFESLAAERRLELQVEVPGPVPARVDPRKIERILLNLVFNAFKFTPPGGRIRLTLGADPEGGRARVEVADSGPGVTPEQREEVFRRFRQLEGSERFGGTGLGLSIARELAELHGGSLVLEAAPEGGALFVLELPVEPALESPPEPPVETRPPLQLALRELQSSADVPPREEAGANDDQGRPLVLVVEDNREMNRFLAECLASDYRVISAYDGREALEAARSARPDLVLTDVMMPGLSGEELLAALRVDPELEATPVLVLTAREDDALRVRLLKEGAQDFLTKPFLAEEVRVRARNLVTVRRALDLLRAQVHSRKQDVQVLAQEVARQQWELRTALEQARVARDLAERASKVKSNFLRMMSHELRTPVTAMQLQLTLLERDSREPLTPRQHATVDRVSRSTRRLLDLIESALEYARVESGRYRARPDTFSLAEVAARVVEDFRSHAEQKGLELELHLGDGIPPLQSDRQLVRLVALNLVGNAVKHTEAGGVRVELGYADDRHLLVVQDTGPGIPAEQQAELFDPFSQVTDLRHKHGPGSGLGLSIVNELVRALGGRIEVESQPGQGSRFSVALPQLEIATSLFDRASSA